MCDYVRHLKHMGTICARVLHKQSDSVKTNELSTDAASPFLWDKDTKGRF